MDFRSWIYNEARLSADVLSRIKEKWGGKNVLPDVVDLRLDPIGNVVLNNALMRQPFLRFSVRDKKVIDFNISPRSKTFHAIIKAIKPHYSDIENWRVSGRDGLSRDLRTVSDWLSLADIRLSNRLPEYLYHGTSTNLWYEAIKDRGLLPRNVTGSTGSYGPKSAETKIRGQLVYLSSDPDFSVKEAASEASKKHGGRPLILRISTQGLDRDRFTDDEDSRDKDDLEMSAQYSFDKMGTVAYRGRIPRENIEPFRIREDDEKKEWIQFHDVPIEEHPVTKLLRKGLVRGQSLPQRYSGQGSYILGHSAEYFALLDAGLIKHDEDDRPYVVNPQGITNDQVKSALRSRFWSMNAQMIHHDLKGNGPLSRLNNKYANKEILDNPSIQLLVDSNFMKKQEDRNWVYFFANTGLSQEERVILLAKALGRKSYNWLVDDLKRLFRLD